jgi:hypothetical protein
MGRNMKKKKIIFNQIPNSIGFGGFLPDDFSEEKYEIELKLSDKYGKGKTAIDFFVTEVKLKGKEIMTEILKKEKMQLENENKEIKECNKKLSDIINELILETRKFLEKNKLDKNTIKISYGYCKVLILQNYNMYPIILNYIDYIKKEILEANHLKSNLKEVFYYISRNITNGFVKPTAIKKYYYDKFLDLIKK